MKNFVENQGIKNDKPLALTYEQLKQQLEAMTAENAVLKSLNSALCTELQEYETDDSESGPTPLIAICRAVVAATLGETVEMPDGFRDAQEEAKL